MTQLFKGDCLEVMDRLIEEGVIVDAIICDPPYGTTACKWDTIIPFEDMWERLNKLIKPNGAIVLFGSEPFSSALRMSNIKNYKYDWVWDKRNSTNPMIVKKRPHKSFENVLLFYKKQPTYNPQMVRKSDDTIAKQKRTQNTNEIKSEHFSHKRVVNVNEYGYPKSVIFFKPTKSNQFKKNIFHPTQKPVALMEYLIKTYTNEGELVLDFTAGSGSTLIGCINTNRRGIGIELDEKYYNIATKRIEDARGAK